MPDKIGFMRKFVIWILNISPSQRHQIEKEGMNLNAVVKATNEYPSIAALERVSSLYQS